jgi:hypothetical protein
VPGPIHLSENSFVDNGDYTITWSIRDDPDGNISGVPPPPSPVTDTLDTLANCDDVYSIELNPTQNIMISLVGDPGTDFDLYLFPPGTTDVGTGESVRRATGSTYPDSLSYLVPNGESGTYYLDVDAFEGSGNYTVTWSIEISDDNIPGALLPPSQ